MDKPKSTKAEQKIYHDRYFSYKGNPLPKTSNHNGRYSFDGGTRSFSNSYSLVM